MSEQIESMGEFEGSAGMARYWDIELNAASAEERGLLVTGPWRGLGGQGGHYD